MWKIPEASTHFPFTHHSVLKQTQAPGLYAKRTERLLPQLKLEMRG